VSRTSSPSRQVVARLFKGDALWRLQWLKSDRSPQIDAQWPKNNCRAEWRQIRDAGCVEIELA
jgi:hypothetical protein